MGSEASRYEKRDRDFSLIIWLNTLFRFNRIDYVKIIYIDVFMIPP